MSMPNLRSVVATVLLAGLALVVWVPTASAAYSLVWSDEFDGTELDAANWSYDLGDGCPSICGWGNNELEYYRAENVDVLGGNLIITTRAESYGGRSFTSGKIHTRDKRSFLYGRVEMRAKIPTGDGMWPAFWMMPQDEAYGEWAASGEIDIMESSNATTSVGGALHYGGGWPDNTFTSGSYSLGGANFADDFHVYAVEWEPDVMRWYVDGVNFMTRTSSQWYSDAAPANPLAPFDQAFYIILNTAVGGWYTGCMETACITADLPQHYFVDYVRVYQETGNIAPVVTITRPTEADITPAGDIVILADASDEDGQVAAVEFYNGTTYLGEDTQAPYGFVWSAVPDGCYALTARAVDNEGADGTDVIDLTVGAGCGQAPYPGAHVLPAIIEAEDFDAGGEGVAYHDLTSVNTGGMYRPDEGVDIQACSDTGGGFNVGWTDAGEWLEYTVEAPATGTYPVEMRVAALSGGGAFRIEIDGVDLTGEIAAPYTGGWQIWTDVDTSLPLEAGTHVMRLVVITSGFNLNRFEVLDTATDVADGLPSPGPVLHPARPNPFNPSTTIVYELPASATVRLVIHDVAGRRVRTLVDAEPLGAGRHETVWNGRDEGGRIVPAGVYFCRLEAGGRAQTTRLVMVK